MKSIKLFGLLSLPILALVACVTPVEQVPISAKQFSDAQKAVEICGQHAPNWSGAKEAFKANDYVNTTDQRLPNAISDTTLEKSESDVVVLLGKEGADAYCLIGIEGMTPQQGFELALPWVRKFDAKTNAERGQGLSKHVVQAWGTLEEDRIVYISAQKKWDLLDAPSAAARLIYIER